MNIDSVPSFPNVGEYLYSQSALSKAMANTPISLETQNRLVSISIDDLEGDAAKLAQEVVLGLPEEHAAIFEAEGSLYSLVRIAEKLGRGSNRKERALAKKMENLFVMCADMKQENAAPEKAKAAVGGPQAKIGAAISKGGKLAPEGLMEIRAAEQKWMAIIRKAEEKNESFKEKLLKGKQGAMQLYELNRYSIELYKEWAGTLDDSKESQKLAKSYAARLLEEQNYRSSKANVERYLQQQTPAAENVKGNYDLLPPGIEKAKLDGIRKEGYRIEAVSNHNCREFVAAYAALREHFGPDELDPSVDLMTMMDAGPVLGKAYQQYFLVTATDKDGKVVGAHDGNYFGSESTSALYGAHIGVYPEAQKLGVATLLYEAALTIGNRYAANAENAWAGRGTKVDYLALIKNSMEPGDNLIRGNRLMYIVGEVEPANLASMETAQATIERNVIHGRMFAFSVIPILDYKQVDLDWPADKPYVENGGKPPAGWNTVPLLLYVRRIGKEGAKQITVGEAKKISRIMTDIFNEAGMYSPEGVEADYQHSIARMKGMLDTDKVSIVELPREASKSKAQLLEEVIKIVPEIGTMHERCAAYYPDYLWAKEYLEQYKKTLKAGTAVTLEQAREYLVAEATRKPEITVKRD